MRGPKWRPPPPPAGVVMGPAMSPAVNEKDQGEHVFMMKDHKKYALHGEILMLVLVSIFSVFIFFIAVLPCIKTASNSNSSSSTSTQSDGYCSHWIKLWRRITSRSSRTRNEDGAPHEVLSHHHHHQQQQQQQQEGINIDEDEISKKV